MDQTVVDALKQVEELEKMPQETKEDEKSTDEARVLTLQEKVMYGQLKPEDIPEGVYKDFMRSVVGGVPFTYSFSLFGGSVRITFGEPKGQTAKELFKIRAMLDLNQAEEIAQLSILTHLHSIEDVTNGKIIYTRPDSLGDINAETQQNLSGWVNDRYAELFDVLGASVMRMVPPLWRIFSGIWAVLINKEIPEGF